MKLIENLKGKHVPSCIAAIILGAIIIGAIKWGAFILLRFIWQWIQELAHTVSAMDTVIIIALISGTITVFGLIVNSIISMRIKNSEFRYNRKAVLLKKLEGPYTQFVNMLFDMVYKKEDADKIDEEVRARLIRDMSREIILYGSDKVVKKWVSYKKKANKFSTTEHLIYLEGLLHLIREDMGIKKGELTHGDLLSLFASDAEDLFDDYHVKFGKVSMSWNASKDLSIDTDDKDDA